MDVKEILNRTPPHTLYHYTTQKGLLGILGTKEIWATHTQYLNDVREFHHALGIVRDELANMSALPANRKLPDLLKEMEEGLNGIEGVNVCVTSFSEMGDLLPQWRAYGGAAGGFSIGFSGSHLRAVLGDQFWLVPCLYDEDLQRTLIRTLVENVLAENKTRQPEQEGGQPPGGNLVAYLNRYAPIVKHHSFKEEQEWRVVSRPMNCKSPRFDYRPGASMLIPYYRLPLETEQLSLSIESVVIGPTPHPEQSMRSVQSLLIRQGLTETKVVLSEAPYRSW